MQNNESINSIYSSRRNLIDQLKHRNFDVTKYNNFSIHEINVLHQTKQLDMILTHLTNESKIYVKYHLDKSLKADVINNYVEMLYEIDETLYKNDELLIIIYDEPNDSIQNELKLIWERSHIYVNVLCIKRLKFNILNKVDIPMHSVMTEQEVKDLFEQYCIENMSQLPNISRFDPMAIAIGLRPNEVCKIERISSTSIKTLYYRCCVNS